MRWRLAKKKQNSAKVENTVDLAENQEGELFASENELERKKNIVKEKKLKAELVEKKRISREIEEKVWKEMNKIIY